MGVPPADRPPRLRSHFGSRSATLCGLESLPGGDVEGCKGPRQDLSCGPPHPSASCYLPRGGSGRARGCGQFSGGFAAGSCHLLSSKAVREMVGNMHGTGGNSGPGKINGGRGYGDRSWSGKGPGPGPLGGHDGKWQCSHCCYFKNGGMVASCGACGKPRLGDAKGPGPAGSGQRGPGAGQDGRTKGKGKHYTGAGGLAEWTCTCHHRNRWWREVCHDCGLDKDVAIWARKSDSSTHPSGDRKGWAGKGGNKGGGKGAASSGDGGGKGQGRVAGTKGECGTPAAAKTPGPQNPMGPGGQRTNGKEARDKLHNLVKAHEAVVAATGEDSEEAKLWGDKVSRARAEVAQSVPQAEKRRHAEWALSKVEKEIAKAYRDLENSEKAMHEANAKFLEAQKRRDEVVKHGTQLEGERRQLQKHLAGLVAEGTVETGTGLVPTLDSMGIQDPEMRRTANDLLQALAAVSQISKARAAGPGQGTHTEVPVGGANALAALDAMLAEGGGRALREGDIYKLGNGVEIRITCESGTSDNPKEDMAMEDDDDDDRSDDGESVASLGGSESGESKWEQVRGRGKIGKKNTRDKAGIEGAKVRAKIGKSNRGSRPTFEEIAAANKNTIQGSPTQPKESGSLLAAGSGTGGASAHNDGGGGWGLPLRRQRQPSPESAANLKIWSRKRQITSHIGKAMSRLGAAHHETGKASTGPTHGRGRGHITAQMREGRVHLSLAGKASARKWSNYRNTGGPGQCARRAHSSNRNKETCTTHGHNGKVRS